MKLSVIIPAYNEKSTIREVIERVLRVDLGQVEKEIIVVDDASTDGTADLVASFVARGLVRLVSHPVNQGKGAAIRTGLQEAQGDYIIIQDADLELNPFEYPRLLAPILAGRCQVVYGSRFMPLSSEEKTALEIRRASVPWQQWLGNKVLTWVTNLLYGTRLTDMETCYKVLPVAVMRSLELKARGFEIEPEITGRLLRSGYRIHEVPVSYVCRDHQQGKKIGWRDGFIALRMLFKCRFLKKGCQPLPAFFGPIPGRANEGW